MTARKSKNAPTPTSGEILKRGQEIWQMLIKDDSEDAQSMFYFESVNSVLCHFYGAALLLVALAEENKIIKQLQLEWLTAQLTENELTLQMLNDLLYLAEEDDKASPAILDEKGDPYPKDLAHALTREALRKAISQYTQEA